MSETKYTKEDLKTMQSWLLESNTPEVVGVLYETVG